MAEFDINQGDKPNVGDEMLMPVNQGSTRTTLFPDQVFAITADMVELILLREEFVVRSQRGVVLAADDQEVHIEFSPQGVRREHFDIGHVRLRTEVAHNLAMSLLVQQVNSGRTTFQEITERLHSMLVDSKL